jgi:AsmA protein
MSSPTPTEKKPSRLSLRLMGFSALLLISLVLIIPLATLFFFDANQFKSEISHFIQEKTGVPITLKGKLSLAWYPQLAITAESVELKNLGNVQKLVLEAQLKPLLKKEVIIDKVILKAPTLHLKKDKHGTFNWEGYLKHHPEENKAPSLNPSTPTAKQSKKLLFSVNHIEVKEGVFAFEDPLKHQTLTLAQVSFKTTGKDAKGKYPIFSDFDYKLIQRNEMLSQGKGEIKGDIFPNKTAALKTQLKGTFPEVFGENEGVFSSDVIIHPNQITLSSFDFQNTKTHLNGNVRILLPFAKDEISGNLAANKLVIKGIHADNIKTQFVKKANMLSLSSLSATLYEGHLRANIQHDLNHQKPTLVRGIAENINIAPLLIDFKQKPTLTGKGNAHFDLGVTPKHLNGTVLLKLHDGMLHGIDIDSVFAKARALLKQETIDVPDRKYTPYESLTGTFKISDNLVYNNDLNLLSQNFQANGDGSLNFNNQTLEYKIKATPIYHDGAKHPNALPIAIRVKGPMDSPHVELDLSVYQALLEQQAKKKLEEKAASKIEREINRKLEKALGKEGEKGEEIQNKIEKEINKGLKKIFKF